jgi:hypothetical protein
MPTPIKPDKFARAAGFDPFDLTEAVQSGEDEYSGLPIGDWRQNGGEYLNVPDEYADQIGLSPESGRSNPSESARKAANALAGDTSHERAKEMMGWPEATREAGPPIAANAGAAHVGARFADTLKEQPQLMEDFVDGAALLGAAGLAYSTAEEGGVLKAGATAAGIFAAFKVIRHACKQQDRRMDAKERQQRAYIQERRMEAKQQLAGLDAPEQSSTVEEGGTVLLKGTS